MTPAKNECRDQMGRYDELCQKWEARQAQIRAYEDVLKSFEAKPAKMQAIMRNHEMVIDNLNDRWQKLAFTFYSELVNIADISRRLREGEK